MHFFNFVNRNNALHSPNPAVSHNESGEILKGGGEPPLSGRVIKEGSAGRVLFAREPRRLINPFPKGVSLLYPFALQFTNAEPVD